MRDRNKHENHGIWRSKYKNSAQREGSACLRCRDLQKKRYSIYSKFSLYQVWINVCGRGDHYCSSWYYTFVHYVPCLQHDRCRKKVLLGKKSHKGNHGKSCAAGCLRRRAESHRYEWKVSETALHQFVSFLLASQSGWMAGHGTSDNTGHRKKVSH